MNSSNTLSRQGHRLLQVGVALFLFTSFEGFAIPYFIVPNLGRSVHTLSAFSGLLLLTLALVWPRLNLGATTSRIAFWFLIYSDLATITAFLMAADSVRPAVDELAYLELVGGLAVVCLHGLRLMLSRRAAEPSTRRALVSWS
jgi:hypothetical protein